MSATCENGCAPKLRAGYVAYDSQTGTFELPPEQALALAVEDSPYFLPGGFQAISSVIHDEPKIREAFRSGAGVAWHEHHHDLFQGTERFFRPGYRANLVSSWIPALDGVEAKLKAGIQVADIGCGHGASTIIMAEAYPNSRFYGFDYHPESIRWATEAAAAKGVSDRVQSAVFNAKGYRAKLTGL